MARAEQITEIGLDHEGRVFVRPADGDFEQVYRAAMEVYWDWDRRVLSHPNSPREWTQLQWFDQILETLRDEYGLELKVTDQTVWTDVPAELKAAILRG